MKIKEIKEMYGHLGGTMKKKTKKEKMWAGLCGTNEMLKEDAFAVFAKTKKEAIEKINILFPQIYPNKIIHNVSAVKVSITKGW